MRKCCVLVVVGFCAGLLHAAVPVPGYVYPSSLQAGTKSRILIGGMSMRGVCGAVFTGEGVAVTKVTQVPAFPRSPGKTQIPWLKDWFYDILDGNLEHRELPPEAVAADTDWPQCDWWANLDARDELELQVVSRFWYTPEYYPQPTPALDQQVILDVEVAQDAKPGLRELIVHDAASCSAPHPFFITKEPHVVEPSFVIPRGEDRKLRVPAILHLPVELPVAVPPVTFDGQAWPGEEDRFRVRLKKGVRYTFEVTARELLPYQGDAVPGFFNPIVELFDPSGKEIACEDDFFYLPDPILSCVAPADGVHTIKIHDNLYRGRQDCVYIIRCYEDSPGGHAYTPQQRAFFCFPPPASHLPPSPSADVDVQNGVIDCPGRTVWNRFTVKEPVTLKFELFARRCGSPLDGVLRLYGPLAPSVPMRSAPLLAEWDDVDKFLAGTIPQAICDPCGSWTFLEPGDYCVSVTDREDRGGESYSYALCRSKLRPDFEIYADRSALLMKGTRAGFALKVVCHDGFSGPIRIEGNDEFDCDAEIDSQSAEPAEVEVVDRKGGWTGLRSAQFQASATLPDGTVIRHRITPTDSAEQAFAYTHLVPQRAFFLYRPERE